MPLFLVTGKLRTSHYMGNKEEDQPVIRLVEARDEPDAQDKLSKFYEDMSSEYCTTYYVMYPEAFPVIT